MNKRKITYRVVLDGIVQNTYTEMRQVYTDEKGEYINCMRNKYYLVNDSYDINFYTGRAISLTDLFKAAV
jgi:hypothetical protein